MMKKKIMASATLAFSMTLAGEKLAIAADDMADMPGMDQSSMAPAPANSDDMRGMDHSKMKHKEAPAQADDMQAMDHSGGGDMKGMSMQGGVAPADARDPHAYSDGYNFDQMRPQEMADEAYMGGILIDRLERARSRDNSFNGYDLQGWFGKDYNKLVLKAEGEADSVKLREARTELLWSHALATFWDGQFGLRYDRGRSDRNLAPDRKWLAFGVQGLAPYWFETDAAAYIGEQGRTALRLSAEYELLLTQKLILQPRIEANFYGQQDAARELGSGLSSLVTGVRVRYEIYRELAPYIGVEWAGKFGSTADYARVAGARINETRVVAGVRFWY